MQLKNNLYKICNKEVAEPSCGKYELELIPSSVIYQAHFPGEPITPGVCIVQIGKELIEDFLQESLQVVLVKNVKFLSVISPIQFTSVTYLLQKVVLSEDSNEVKTQIIVTSGDETKAKISMVLRLMKETE